MSESYLDIKLPESLKKIRKCDMCSKPLPKRHVIHKNIGQEPPEHKFCSRTCKEKWCHDQKSV